MPCHGVARLGTAVCRTPPPEPPPLGAQMPLPSSTTACARTRAVQENSGKQTPSREQNQETEAGLQVGRQRHTAQHSTTQHNTAQHSTTQHNTAQHNTAQHSTAQHSTTQHNTVAVSGKRQKTCEEHNHEGPLSQLRSASSPRGSWLALRAGILPKRGGTPCYLACRCMAVQRLCTLRT